MKPLCKLIEKYNIEPLRYTIKNSVTIIDCNSSSYVLKRKCNKDASLGETYKYLRSCNFNYFCKLIDEDDEFQLFEKLEEVDIPKEQKVFDYFLLISLLHNKTSYYKEINIDENKELYEKIKVNITYMRNYYDDVINVIEGKVYMSPSEYLLARNISKIYGALEYCNYYIDKWYELVKDKNKKRVVMLYNNPDLNHVIKNEDLHLISWGKTYRDLPIYDFLVFYQKYALNFDFEEILQFYESRYPLLEEEKILLYVLMSIPKKIIFNNSEYDNCTYIRRYLDCLYKTENLVTSDKDSPS